MFHTASIVNRGVALSQRRTLPGSGGRQQDLLAASCQSHSQPKSALESARLGKYPDKLNESQVSRATSKAKIPESELGEGARGASHACTTYGEFTISMQNGRSEKYGDR